MKQMFSGKTEVTIEHKNGRLTICKIAIKATLYTRTRIIYMFVIWKIWMISINRLIAMTPVFFIMNSKESEI